MTKQLEQFFADYEKRTNAALSDPPQLDIDGVMGSFTDCFIEASPVGVSCGKTDDAFREAIPKGYEFYRSIGTKQMKIASQTITPLDDYHAQVKIHWESSYEKKDGSKVVLDFDVIYFVQTLEGKPKIFAYISGDEQQAYKDNGLVPEE